MCSCAAESAAFEQFQSEVVMKDVQNTELELVIIEELEAKIAPSTESGFLE
jgi:hypothetical protein